MNREIDIPDLARIYELWEKYETPEGVIAHSKAVWELCQEIIAQIGVQVDKEYIRAAALLHDIVRYKPKHEEAGAEILKKEGCLELAETVRRHSDFKQQEWQMPFALETAILYLADKQVSGTERVSIEARFAKSRERIRLNGDTPEAVAAHRRKYEQAMEMQAWVNAKRR